MARIWIVSTIPVAPTAPSVLKFGADREAARTEYIRQITEIGAPADKIAADSTVVLADNTTLQYTDPVSGTRVVLSTARA